MPAPTSPLVADAGDTLGLEYDGSTGIGPGCQFLIQAERDGSGVRCNGMAATDAHVMFFDANRKRAYATGKRLSSCLTLALPIAQWRRKKPSPPQAPPFPRALALLVRAGAAGVWLHQASL